MALLPMSAALRRTLLGCLIVVLGAVGYVLASVCADLYQDHQQHHQIWDLELRRAAAAQQAQTPSGAK